MLFNGLSALQSVHLSRLFVVVGALFLLTVAVFFHLLNSEKNIAIHFAQKEIEGGLYLRPLRQITEHLYRYHECAQLQPFNRLTDQENLLSIAKKIDDDFAQLREVDVKLAEHFKTGRNVEALEHSWRDLQGQPASLRMEEDNRLYLIFMSDVQKLISQIGDTSNLILDPDLDSYYAMDAVLLKLPAAQAFLFQLEVLTTQAYLKTGILTLEDKVRLISLAGNFESNISSLNVNLRTGFQNNFSRELQPALEELLGQYTVSAQSVVRSFDGLLQMESTRLDRFEKTDAFVDDAIVDNFKLWDRSIGALDDLLRARIARFEASKRYALLIVVLMGALTFLSGALIFQIIASRKKSEDELRASEERFRAISEASPLGIYMADSEGNNVYVNQVCQTIIGLTSEESIGRGWSNSIHPDDRDRVTAKWYEFARNPTVFESEHRFLRKDGSSVWASVKSSPIFEKKSIVGFVGTVEDITLRKRLEEQLLQSQKMETVGSLAGGVAHDLNNHLTPLTGYLDLILQGTSHNDSSYPLLQEAHQASRRCAEVVQRLLNFSHSSTQKKTQVHVEGLLEELKGLLRNFLPSTIQIKISAHGKIHPIAGNETELQTVLLNLAANSRDAMADGGFFTVEAQNVRLEALMVKPGHPTGEYVLIQTRDTGNGISAEVIKRIFEPFFTTKTKGRGTGLGLAMVFSIVKDHGGWVEVSSEAGQGTQFNIYLPASTVQGEDVFLNPEVSVELPTGNETILLVDDEEPLRLMGKTFLSRLGYSVLTAVDGQDAVRVYRAHSKDIAAILMDMTMPKLTGRQALSKLIEINPKARVIVISGYTSEGSIQELLDDGAAAYIPKPYEISVLAKTLREVIDRGN